MQIFNIFIILSSLNFVTDSFVVLRKISPSRIFAEPPRVILPGFQSYQPSKTPENDLLYIPSPTPTPTPTPTPSPPKIQLPGISIGIPLNIITYVFTTHHYGENIMTFQLVALNCLVGFYTYGMDRMLDAIQYKKSGMPLSKKESLYQYILENYDILKNIYDATYWMFVLVLLATPENGIQIQTIEFIILYELAKFFSNLRYSFYSFYLGTYSYRLFAFYFIIALLAYQSHWFDHEFQFFPLLLALDTAKYYPDIKRKYGWFKCIYVAAMWCGPIAIIPGLLHDGNYEILGNMDILAPFLLMAGLSNIVDIRDIDEDKENGIQTIPVMFGTNASIAASMISIIGAWWIFDSIPR